jgi:hypothetical protein
MRKLSAGNAGNGAEKTEHLTPINRLPGAEPGCLSSPVRLFERWLAPAETFRWRPSQRISRASHARRPGLLAREAIRAQWAVVLAAAHPRQRGQLQARPTRPPMTQLWAVSGSAVLFAKTVQNGGYARLADSREGAPPKSGAVSAASRPLSIVGRRRTPTRSRRSRRAE